LIPPWLVFAFDHAMFIGVMTNGLIGLGMVLSGDRRQVWSWADDLAFWGINVGLVGFVIGLLVQSVALKRVSAPLMGAGILVALLALSMRLQRSRAPVPRPAT
jgi:predicted membrane protein